MEDLSLEELVIVTHQVQELQLVELQMVLDQLNKDTIKEVPDMVNKEVAMVNKEVKVVMEDK